MLQPQSLHNCINCTVREKSIFCELKANEVQALDAAKSSVVYKKADLIFSEGASPRGLYCVSNGKVKVSQLGIDGKEQIVHLAKDGDVMGYRAILSGDTYSCTATAIEDSSLCFIPKNVFFAMVEGNSKLALQIVNLFSIEIKEAEKKITRTAQRPVKERLAQCLLLLKESYGFEEDDCTINVTTTREELANIAGTTRETATRLLYELNNDKIIELCGKKIKIIHLQNLTKEARLFD
jgi:CRP-like cAMP-binding protein